MQGVVKYVRVTFDLFPDRRQVCVAAVDCSKCQPVNSWRDEDQELSKVSPAPLSLSLWAAHLSGCGLGVVRVPKVWVAQYRYRPRSPAHWPRPHPTESLCSGSAVWSEVFGSADSHTVFSDHLSRAQAPRQSGETDPPLFPSQVHPLPTLTLHTHHCAHTLHHAHTSQFSRHQGVRGDSREDGQE